MIPPELITKIRRIQIRTSHMVSDVLAGQYHSAFKGRGMEFEEVRAYQYGDDVRTIDWNVSARTGEPFVKMFREERELTVMLVVDVSASQQFGTAVQLKQDLVAELCATLAFSAIQNNDKVGLVLFTDKVEKLLPPRKGTRHVLRVVRDLLYHPASGRGTDLASALDTLNQVTRQRAVVFVVSDFITGRFEHPLRVARQRHDIIPIIVTDPAEIVLPNVGLVELCDAETGDMIVVDTSSRRVRNAFEQHRAESAEARTQLFRRLRIDAIDVTTGGSFIEPVMRFFRSRKDRH
jgi:uncharacterized protein (DUF58 family)